MKRVAMLAAVVVCLSAAALAQHTSVYFGVGINSGGPRVYRPAYPVYVPGYPVFYGPRYPVLYGPGYPVACGPNCRYRMWQRHEWREQRWFREEQRERRWFRRHELCERGYWRYCGRP